MSRHSDPLPWSVASDHCTCLDGEPSDGPIDLHLEYHDNKHRVADPVQLDWRHALGCVPGYDLEPVVAERPCVGHRDIRHIRICHRNEWSRDRLCQCESA